MTDNTNAYILSKRTFKLIFDINKITTITTNAVAGKFT